MTSNPSHYIPALGVRWLTPFYDSLLKWGMREEIIKRRLIERANIQPGQRILDLGSGTGTLVIMLKQFMPETQVAGLDGDPEILAIARDKAKRASVEITWDQGLAYDLPYSDNSFDLVLSSFVVHHLTSAEKVRAFREAHRVLRPGGGFHILDFGRPYNNLTKIQAWAFKSFEDTADNFNGRILPMLKEAGFGSASEAEHVTNIFGPIWFYEAFKSQDKT